MHHYPGNKGLHVSELKLRLWNALPWRIRNAIRKQHQRIALTRSFEAFLSDIDSNSAPLESTLQGLVYGWGNRSWSGQPEYLAGCIDQVRKCDGPILECGSGLSTILLGAVAQRRGLPYVALENNPMWSRRVASHLTKFHITGVKLCTAELKDYGDFSWYDPPLHELPDRFSLIVCDGPPATTKGGRSGLLPVMRSRIVPPCVILLDDAVREQERALAQQWASELGAASDVIGVHKPYLKIQLEQ